MSRDPDRAVGLSGAGVPVGRTFVFAVVAVVDELGGDVVAGVVAVVVVTGAVVVVVEAAVVGVVFGAVVGLAPPEPCEPGVEP